ncbi:serine/threonine protein kinase [Candidatus Micrarchaeota archaeon]|nr:serine/threonine protein kinase [Candidatus Micrarchaeota archaeon]
MATAPTPGTGALRLAYSAGAAPAQKDPDREDRGFGRRPRDPQHDTTATGTITARRTSVIVELEATGLRRVEPLDRGGMGCIYSAYKDGVKVVVKVSTIEGGSDDAMGARARFVRERQTAEAVRHPNIVEIVGSGSIALDSRKYRTPYIVMEYVDGRDLGKILKQEGPLSVESALPVLRQLAAAVEAVHKEGILHRGIKPANVMLTEDGVVKLTDFGIAKRLTDEVMVATSTGQMVGSAPYMSVEHAARPNDVDARADIFSFGVTAFEILTGKRPYKGDTQAAMLIAKMNEDWDLEPLGSAPKELVEILTKCIRHKPTDRYQSMAEVIQALEGLGQGSQDETVVRERTQVVLIPQLVPEKKSGWMAKAAMAAAVVATVGAFAGVAIARRTQSPQPPLAHVQVRLR